MTASTAPSRWLSKARSPLSQPRVSWVASRIDWAMSKASAVLPSAWGTRVRFSTRVRVSPSTVTVSVGVPTTVCPSASRSFTTNWPLWKKSLPKAK